MFRKLKIAMTGSSGVLGIHFKSIFPDNQYYLFHGDINTTSSLSSWINELPDDINIVLHFVANVAVLDVEQNPEKSWNVNVLGGLNLLKLFYANKKNILPWFFFASSAHVYKTSDHLLKETSEIAPISLYGKQKAEMEKLVLSFAEQNNIDCCVGRIFSYSSVLQNKKFLIPNLINRVKYAQYGSSINLVGYENCRDFLTPRQISEVISELYLKKVTGCINIGSGISTSIQKVAKTIIDMMPNKNLIIQPESGLKTSIIADTTRLKEYGIQIQGGGINNLIAFVLNGDIV